MEETGEDGRIRTGTVWTATAHVVTAIVGSGILTLPWSVAQLGWILGPVVLVFFAFITYFTAILLSDCYRYPDPTNGKRNKTYMDAIRACLGNKDVLICGIIQYSLLWGTMVGYTVTSAMSMMAIDKSMCFHKKGLNAGSCEPSGILYTAIFGAIEVFLSQFPSLEKATVLSYIAAAMSFAYSFIGLCLCALEFSSHPNIKGTLLGTKIGVSNISLTTKVWCSFQALGNIAFAYTFSMLLIEIQDTLKSPPSENKIMKKASIYGIGSTTLFYISLGCVGYAAFGNDTPGNILTGFLEPFWLIQIANLAVLIHLFGAYQIFAQPIFAFYEGWLAKKWPNVGFFKRVYTLSIPFSRSKRIKFTLCKLILRTLLVLFTTVVAMLLPFFNAIVGLIGALGFWPLTVYYPVSMYINQAKIKRTQRKWFMLQVMSLFCLLVTLLGGIGSIADIIQHLKHAQLFKMNP
ncbi:amino acid permease 4-like [Canna indica]|uniref:Amino acid permease 4-like n=1 Tax=Canna indica TaxID=4628 RepID=A0AAQ3QCM3_9LILI|nr:amino acid permease 4-like [Canna indica]